jgi:hypothetical protein
MDLHATARHATPTQSPPAESKRMTRQLPAASSYATRRRVRFGGMEGVGAWRRWRWRWRWRGRRCDGCVVETNGGSRG